MLIDTSWNVVYCGWKYKGETVFVTQFDKVLLLLNLVAGASTEGERAAGKDAGGESA